MKPKPQAAPAPRSRTQQQEGELTPVYLERIARSRFQCRKCGRKYAGTECIFAADKQDLVCGDSECKGDLITIHEPSGRLTGAGFMPPMTPTDPRKVN